MFSSYSLRDSCFAPTRVIVVSEERLQAAERKAKEDQITAVDVRINELTKYRENLKEELASLQPAKTGKDLDSLDGSCDV